MIIAKQLAAYLLNHQLIGQGQKYTIKSTIPSGLIVGTSVHPMQERMFRDACVLDYAVAF